MSQGRTCEALAIKSFGSFLKERFVAGHFSNIKKLNMEKFYTDNEQIVLNKEMYCYDDWDSDRSQIPASNKESNKYNSILSPYPSKEIIEIKIPKEFKYVSQLPSDILERFNNCIINKQVCGCGFTNYYLNANMDCIIAVPNVDLIKNKTSQLNRKNIMGVYGSIDEETIANFWNNPSIQFKKILCTYNALEKVVNAIDKVDNVFSIQLVIDEYQVLLTDLSFRKEIIKQTVNISQRFNNIVFVSATPIKHIYLPAELQKLPIIQLYWENFQKIKVIRYTTREYKSEIRKLINNRIKKKSLVNLYIFCNSITWIMQMISSMKLSEDDVKIVCSKSNSNNEKATKGYSIYGLDDKDEDGNYKPINFITSTAFAGCDCYDRNGQAIIVSDNRYCSTMIDISLQIAQIAGRLRCTRYNDILHYCSGSLRYDNISDFDSYKRKVERKCWESQQIVNRDKDYDPDNITEKNLRLKQKDSYENDAYLNVDKNTGEFSLDLEKAKFDLWSYESMRINYYSSEAYNKAADEAGLNVKEVAIKNEYPSDKLAKNPHRKIKLSEALWEYIRLAEHEYSGSLDVLERMDILENKYPDLPFMKSIGYTKVKELNFSVKRVREYKQSIETNNMHNIISESIKKVYNIEIKEEEYIPHKKIRTSLNEIYKEQNINKKASAEDVLEYFPKSKKTKRIIDGKQQRCIKISIC